MGLCEPIVSVMADAWLELVGEPDVEDPDVWLQDYLETNHPFQNLWLAQLMHSQLSPISFTRGQRKLLCACAPQTLAFQESVAPEEPKAREGSSASGWLPSGSACFTSSASAKSSRRSRRLRDDRCRASRPQSTDTIARRRRLVIETLCGKCYVVVLEKRAVD